MRPIEDAKGGCMKALEHCPNCGSELVRLNRKRGKFQYECDGDCWTKTRWYWSEQEAAFAWNKLKKESKEDSDAE